jgi:hypothetical protein
MKDEVPEDDESVKLSEYLQSCRHLLGEQVSRTYRPVPVQLVCWYILHTYSKLVIVLVSTAIMKCSFTYHQVPVERARSAGPAMLLEMTNDDGGTELDLLTDSMQTVMSVTTDSTRSPRSWPGQTDSTARLDSFPRPAGRDRRPNNKEPATTDRRRLGSARLIRFLRSEDAPMADRWRAHPTSNIKH